MLAVFLGKHFSGEMKGGKWGSEGRVEEAMVEEGGVMGAEVKGGEESTGQSQPNPTTSTTTK